MTDQKPKVLVFVPTLNDFELLAHIAAQVVELSPEYTVLVVDDGSHRPFDATLLPGRCLYFRLPDNVGLGVCTHIAFDHALRHGYEQVARIDADGQHPVERLVELVAALSEKAVDIVVGVRKNHRGQGVGALLAIVIKSYFVFVGRLVTGGRSPRDMNTGFFVLNKRAVHLLNNMELDRYPEPLLFIRACRGGLKVAEIDIDQRERLYGQSSLNLVQALRMFYRFNVTVLAELFQKRCAR